MFAYVSHDLKKQIKKEIGATFIELMIAITLGLLFLIFLIELYTASVHNYKTQMALQQLQENAKMAAALFNSEIKLAGNIGCARLNGDFPIIAYSGYSITPQNKLSGTNAEIIVKHAALKTVILTNQSDSSLTVSSEIIFKPGDILLISDCEKAELFQVHKIYLYHQLQQIIPTQPLVFTFKNKAEISRLEINKFFIAKTNRHYEDGSIVNSLFVEEINHHKTELIEGIDRIEIKYTVRQQNQIVEMDTPDIKDWSEIVGINLALTMHFPPFKKNWYIYVSL